MSVVWEWFTRLLQGLLQGCNQDWGLFWRLKQGRIPFNSHVTIDSIQFLSGCWLALSFIQYRPLQHGSLLPQSQQGGQSANKMEVTGLCSLILEVPLHQLCYIC